MSCVRRLQPPEEYKLHRIKSSVVSSVSQPTIHLCRLANSHLPCCPLQQNIQHQSTSQQFLIHIDNMSHKGLIGNTVNVVYWKLARKGRLFPVLINFQRLSLFALGLATWKIADLGLSLCSQFSEGNGYVTTIEWWLLCTQVSGHSWVAILWHWP
jgi:hypothetical protein